MVVMWYFLCMLYLYNTIHKISARHNTLSRYVVLYKAIYVGC